MHVIGNLLVLTTTYDRFSRPTFSQGPVAHILNGNHMHHYPFHLVLPVDVKHTVTIKGNADKINIIHDSSH